MQLSNEIKNRSFTEIKSNRFTLIVFSGILHRLLQDVIPSLYNASLVKRDRYIELNAIYLAKTPLRSCYTHTRITYFYTARQS